MKEGPLNLVGEQWAVTSMRVSIRSVLIDLYKEKHATFEFSPFLHFNPDRDVLLQELNTVCHVPMQGIENVESSLWPADDNWPKENR